jgi:hypothetical protein
MTDSEAHRQWLLKEMADQARKITQARDHGDPYAEGFADGCLDGYVRLGARLSIDTQAALSAFAAEKANYAERYGGVAGEKG